MNRTREQIADSIIKFAERNHLHIHPGQDPHAWADLVIEKDGCPCVPSRKSCPCSFAMADIEQLGRCRCGVFCNDGYVDNFNSLKKEAKDKKKEPSAAIDMSILPPMDGRARGEFLKKISVNGFSLEDNHDILVLRPRGMESEAEISIQEVAPNEWKVVGATGKFAGYNRGQKRKFFEDHISRWVVESLLQAP